MADKAEKAEKKAKENPAEVDVNAFISRKLKVINDLYDEAEKRFLADRVLGNKRGKK